MGEERREVRSGGVFTLLFEKFFITEILRVRERREEIRSDPIRDWGEIVKCKHRTQTHTCRTFNYWPESRSSITLINLKVDESRWWWLCCCCCITISAVMGWSVFWCWGRRLKEIHGKNLCHWRRTCWEAGKQVYVTFIRLLLFSLPEKTVSQFRSESSSSSSIPSEFDFVPPILRMGDAMRVGEKLWK